MFSALPPTSDIRAQRCFTIESVMAGSVYLRLCAPSVPVSDNEFRGPERLGQADGLAPSGLEISSDLCSQAHEENAA
jgi:hypothetical protein